MPDNRPPRIALLGFSIECNRFAPVATRAHFGYFAGDDIVAEAREPAPRMLGEIPGFVADMDAAGPWEPVGIAFAAAEPNGRSGFRKMVYRGGCGPWLSTIRRRTYAF